MRKTAIACMVSLCFMLIITFNASAHTKPSSFTTSSLLTASHASTSNGHAKSSSVRPFTATCTVTQSGRLSGKALTVTSRLSCNESFVGTISIQAQHCGLVVLGVCVYIDETINMPTCNITANNPVCVRSTILNYTGLWYITSNGWAVVADGGTGSGSTTAAINV